MKMSEVALIRSRLMKAHSKAEVDLKNLTLRNRITISKEDQTYQTILENKTEDEKHHTRPQTGDTFSKDQ
jgi:hypothetical protein